MTLRKLGCVLVLCGFLLAGCGAGDEAPVAGTDVEDIVSPPDDSGVLRFPVEWVDPVSYVGEPVRVSAEVGRVVGPRAFTLESDGEVVPLLVVHDGDAEPKVEQRVLAVGTVRNAFLPEQVKEIAPDATEALFEDWAAEPYLRAEAVTPDPGAQS